MGKGRGPTLLLSNWTYLSTVVIYRGWGMAGRRAGSSVAVYAQVQCQEPKIGQQKVQISSEDETLCPSVFIIYLWFHQSRYTLTYNWLPVFKENLELLILGIQDLAEKCFFYWRFDKIWSSDKVWGYQLWKYVYPVLVFTDSILL